MASYVFGNTHLWSVPICASFTGVCSWADLKPPSLCREAKLFISDEKTSIPNVVWLFAGSMSHGHQGIIIDCLAQATAICPHCKTLNLALNKNWHLRLNLLSMYGFPTLFPTIVSWLRSCNRVKNLLGKNSVSNGVSNSYRCYQRS